MTSDLIFYLSCMALNIEKASNMNQEQLEKLLPLRIDATGEYLLIEPETLGELMLELLETGEDRPAAEVADKLDKYVAREKLFQAWRTLGLKLQDGTWK